MEIYKYIYIFKLIFIKATDENANKIINTIRSKMAETNQEHRIIHAR